MQVHEQFFARPHSIGEVCGWIDCTRQYLNKEIRDGKLRVRKLSPKLVRIMPADLLQWLDRAASPPLPNTEASASHAGREDDEPSKKCVSPGADKRTMPTEKKEERETPGSEPGASQRELNPELSSQHEKTTSKSNNGPT
jgi:hypothetical protein